MYRPPIADQASAIWPIVGAPMPTHQDGALALVLAVLAAARRHRGKLAAWVLFCIAAAMIYGYTATPSYTATATLLLEPRRQTPAGGPESAATPVLDLSRADSELQVLRSERLLSNVFNSLALADHPEFMPQPPGLLRLWRKGLEQAVGLPPPRPQSPEDIRQVTFENFAQRINVRRVGQSYVVEVSYTSTDPSLARRVANASVAAYLLQSVAWKAEAAKNGAEFIQSRVNALSAEARAAAAAVAAGALPETPTPDADARVIGAALQPLTPSAPRKWLVLALGAAIGLVGGFFGIALNHAFDRRIRTPEDILHRCGLACLASVPEVGKLGKRRWRGATDLTALATQRPETAFAAAIRDLRTSIQLVALPKHGDGHVAIGLVSWRADAGRSLIGINLAHVIRAGGRKVTLIDADFTGSRSWAGADVSDVTTLADLLESGSALGPVRTLDCAGVDVVPARSGRSGLSGACHLGAPALEQVINQARYDGDVILDLPALSGSVEARAGALRTDAVVIVVEADRTTVDQLAEAVRSLRSLGVNVIGAVLNRVKA